MFHLPLGPPQPPPLRKGLKNTKYFLGLYQSKEGREDREGQIYLSAHTALVWLSPVAQCVNWL